MTVDKITLALQGLTIYLMAILWGMILYFAYERTWAILLFLPIALVLTYIIYKAMKES